VLGPQSGSEVADREPDLVVLGAEANDDLALVGRGIGVLDGVGDQLVDDDAHLHGVLAGHLERRGLQFDVDAAVGRRRPQPPAQLLEVGVELHRLDRAGLVEDGMDVGDRLYPVDRLQQLLLDLGQI
jgi:hypothetical protein